MLAWNTVKCRRTSSPRSRVTVPADPTNKASPTANPIRRVGRRGINGFALHKKIREPAGLSRRAFARNWPSPPPGLLPDHAIAPLSNPYRPELGAPPSKRAMAAFHRLSPCSLPRFPLGTADTRLPDGLAQDASEPPPIATTARKSASIAGWGALDQGLKGPNALDLNTHPAQRSKEPRQAGGRFCQYTAGCCGRSHAQGFRRTASSNRLRKVQSRMVRGPRRPEPQPTPLGDMLANESLNSPAGRRCGRRPPRALFRQHSAR